jgi:hypothetical protein
MGRVRKPEDRLRHMDRGRPYRLNKRVGFGRLALAALAQLEEREKALAILRKKKTA